MRITPPDAKGCHGEFFLVHSVRMEKITVHLAPSELFALWGFPVTNTLLTAWLTVLAIIVLVVLVRKNMKLVPNKAMVLVESVVLEGLAYTERTLENAALARKIFPFILSIFVFVLLGGLIGLLPGVGGVYTGEHHTYVLYPPYTDLNLTIGFAIMAFLFIEFIGITTLGFWKYGGKFVNLHSPIGFVVGIIELISEVARLISFSFRLFGNIFAGKMLIVVAMAFLPYILPVPLLLYEVLVAFIQASVFAILTLFFVKIAVMEPH